MASISATSTAWAILVVAGLLEIVWSSAMKASEGFTKHLYTGIMLVAACLSFWLLGLAIKSLPLGTAYAVWTGIGVLSSTLG
jgi:quaternary ammonium compound-resistance protein SugE